MVGEVHAPREAFNRMDRLLAKGSGRLWYAALVRLDDERNDELQELFDVRAEREEDIEDLHLSVCSLFV